ncbi:hypothetical protein AB1Y20_008735 [Prymnesium parvum]|uniref:Uncharacterized protein n=1 Tax=Prymnesium parvum TaxID=97485 RepID=A0AB34IUP8_PRYPA
MQECAESTACPRGSTRPHPRLALVAELVSTIYHSLALTQTGGRHRLPFLFNDEGMRTQSIKAASKQRRLLRASRSTARAMRRGRTQRGAARHPQADGALLTRRGLSGWGNELARSWEDVERTTGAAAGVK